MKTSKKFRSLMVSAAVLGMMGSSLVSTATAVMAAGETGEKISVTIHKKDALNYNGEINNTGKELTLTDPNLKPMSGVEFSIYDVSDAFYDMFLGTDEDDSMVGKGEDIIKKITDNIQDYVGSSNFVQKNDTDGNGQYKMSLNRLTTNDRPAVYAVVETDSKMAPAQPIVFSTNIKDKENDNKPLESIHLYPKNYTLDKVMVGHEDESKPAVDVGVGDVLTYEVDFAIPFDIKDTAYTNIKLTDTLKGANIVEGSVKVFQGNTELTDSLKPVKDTNLTYGGTGDTLFTLSYDLTKTAVKDDMSNYPGKTLTVQYKVEVTNEMFGDDEAQNKAVLNVNSPSGESSQEDTSIPFTPGGLTGIKVGATEDSKPLQGAKFALYRLDENGKKQYASFDVNGLPNPKTITWGESGGQMDATSRLTSGEDGTVSISGLKYGTYYLEETKAPNGFILPKEEDRSQSIVVSEGTYTQAVAEMEKIYNVPEAEGELPLTGGIGVLTLIAVGGTIMVMTTLRKKKED